MDEYIKLKLNTDLANCKKGQVITLKSCRGIPLDRYWRKRLLDSIHDKCVDVVSDKKIEEKEDKDFNKEIKKLRR